MTESGLPVAFRTLQPFLGWALATEAERTRKRQTSEMADIQAFYTAMLSHLEEILVYLNQFPLERMPASRAATHGYDSLARRDCAGGRAVWSAARR